MSLLMLVVAAWADEKDAETCLQTKVWAGYGDGWGVRTMTSTSLPDGKTRNYLVTLYEGNDYRIQTCADAQVANLDLLLYDTKGNVLARDESVGREPELAYTPTATGTYYIVLYHREAAKADAIGGAAMAVVYR
jgi:hypothetical protein